MISRSTLARGSRLALQGQTCLKLAQRRGYAAAAPTPASYEQTEASGVKIASKDSHGPTTRLALVAKAGTRYEPAPGLTVGLEEFAFKNTDKRSALRIVRESELLGGQLAAYHTREAVVLQASFLREHLPYFAELLAEVISETRYSSYEFHEEVQRVVHLKQARLDALTLALDLVHTAAFHTGLGEPLYPTASTPVPALNEHSIAAYGQAVYSKAGIALVADGASQSNVTKWAETFFKNVPATSSSNVQLNSSGSKYFGGEQRLPHLGKNAFVIALPGSSVAETKAETSVLVALLGGESSISWSPGFTLLSKAAAAAPGATAHASNIAYSDAGLLTIQITGPSHAVRIAAEESVKALKSVVSGSIAKEDLTKAIAKAKFDLLSAIELTGDGLVSTGSRLVHGSKPLQIAEFAKSLESVTADKLKAAAKSLLDGKASVAAVGDLHVLPFAEDLGLKV